MLEQVQEARRRVLADLAARRRALGIQIEQLRAARDEMAASVHGVRDRVDGILSHLDRSDEEARAAAVAVAEQFRLQGGPDEPHDQDSLDEVIAEGPDEGPAPAVRVIDGDVDEPGAGTGVASDDVAAANAPSVDELFARIRAGAPDEVAEAGAGAAAPEPATEAVPEAATQAMDVVVVEEQVEAADAAPVGPDDPLIAQRDELLGPVTARLSRAVKRALGDDQNRLLDRIRSSPLLSGDELLGPEEEHRAVFELAVRTHLGEAYAAGAAFAGATAANLPDDGTVAESSTGLAHVVVTMLRRQVEDDGGDLGDQVSAAYREWRGERVQRARVTTQRRPSRRAWWRRARTEAALGRDVGRPGVRTARTMRWPGRSARARRSRPAMRTHPPTRAAAVSWRRRATELEFQLARTARGAARA